MSTRILLFQWGFIIHWETCKFIINSILTSNKRTAWSAENFLPFALLVKKYFVFCLLQPLLYTLPVLTYLLTPWSRVLLEKLTGFQLVKKFPAFYGTRNFITAFISARHLSLSWASHSIPTHPTSWRSTLILFSHLRMVLSSGIFPSGFPPRNLYTPLSSPIGTTCSVHLIMYTFPVQ